MRGRCPMEPYLADLINNPKVPKPIRYIIVIITLVFLKFIFICVGFNSIYLVGKIFGFILTILFLILGIYLILKIHKN